MTEFTMMADFFCDLSDNKLFASFLFTQQSKMKHFCTSTVKFYLEQLDVRRKTLTKLHGF